MLRARVGIICSSIVASVTESCIRGARMAAETIIKARDMNKLGIRLSNFIYRIYDMEGPHVKALDKAACNLSKFSVKELETVFNTNSEALQFLCKSLTQKTRKAMSYHAHDGYQSFAVDSIGILLPIIYNRRNRLGIPTAMRSNSFIDVLRTVPKFSTWTPIHGTLRLELDDIRTAHASCRKILEDLNLKRVLVSRIGSDAGKRKIVYEFDTTILWHVLTQGVAFRV